MKIKNKVKQGPKIQIDIPLSRHEVKLLNLILEIFETSLEVKYKNKCYRKLKLIDISKKLNIKTINTISKKIKKFERLKLLNIIYIKNKLFAKSTLEKGGFEIMKRRMILPNNIKSEFNDVVAAYNIVMTGGKKYSIYPLPEEKHEKYFFLFKDVTEFLMKLIYRPDGSKREISMKLFAVNYFNEYEGLTKNKRYRHFRILLIKAFYVKKYFIEWVKSKDHVYMSKTAVRKGREVIKKAEKKYHDNISKHGFIKYTDIFIQKEQNDEDIESIISDENAD